MVRGRDAAELIDRLDERGVIDRLIGAVRSGQSQVLVMHGEPGIGKTALLGYLARRVEGCGGNAGGRVRRTPARGAT
jgi:predicted ATPase